MHKDINNNYYSDGVGKRWNINLALLSPLLSSIITQCVYLC